MLAKPILVNLRCRSRERTTSKVALKSTSNKEKTSALAPAWYRLSRLRQGHKDNCYANMVRKSFATEDGCKKGKSCEAKHVPIKGQRLYYLWFTSSRYSKLVESVIEHSHAYATTTGRTPMFLDPARKKLCTS
eukprot:386295-Amphidinium_carterae.2